MGLVKELRTGKHGVRFKLPNQIELRTDQPEVLQWVDRQGTYQGAAKLSAFPLDVSDRRRPTMRAELEAEADRLFDGPLALPDDCSPIVDFELVERRDARMIRCVHRTARGADFERLRGVLCLPFGHRHLKLSIEAVEPVAPGLSRQADALARREAEHAAVELDARYPTHTLTRIRQTLDQWAESKNGGLFALHKPVELLGADFRVDLPNCSSSVEVPNGFLPVVTKIPTAVASYQMFAQLGLVAHPINLMDIYRVDYARPTTAESLLDYVEANTEGGTRNHGLQRLHTRSEIVPTRDHAAEVRTEFGLVMKGEPKITLGHWILTNDGIVFRFGITFQPPDTYDMWRPVLDRVLKSWRQLPLPAGVKPARSRQFS